MELFVLDRNTWNHLAVQKNKLRHIYKSYIYIYIYMYKHDLALNNL